MALLIYVATVEGAILLIGIVAIVLVHVARRNTTLTAASGLLLTGVYILPIAAGLPTYKQLCKEHRATVVAERVKADSYLWDGYGSEKFGDFGINSVFDDLRTRRMSYLEVQQPHWALGFDFMSPEGRKEFEKPGTYRISIAKVSSPACRVRLGDRSPFSSRLYADECITVEKVASPSSRYSVTYFRRAVIPLMPIQDFGFTIEDRMEGKELARISILEYAPRDSLLIFSKLFVSLDDVATQCPNDRRDREANMIRTLSQVLHGST